MNEMKNLIILIALIFICSLASAQEPARKKLIEEAKTELITKRIKLTEAQAEKFWPVYNEYTDKKLELRRTVRSLKRDGFTIVSTDEEILKSLDKLLDYKQKEVDLEKDYKTKLLKVISARQLAELYITEQEFIKRLVEIWSNRKPGKMDE